MNNLNLQEINQEEALNLVRFYLKSGQNICLFGQRGIGKTSISIQAAQDIKYKLTTVNLSVVERPDLAGFPILNSNEENINYKLPFFFTKLKKDEKPNTIILFDEIDKTSPEITAPLLEILQFRTINGVPLNIAGCILTGNLPDEKAHSNSISSAILDRCAKYIVSFDFNNWIVWARKNKIHDLILAFLSNNPELVIGETNTDTYASASPRGWTMASNAIIKAKNNKIVDIDTIYNIVCGFVGKDIGIKFKLWYEYYRKFTPIINSLIDNGNCSINYSELEPTEKLVFCITLCHLTKLKLIEDCKSSINYKSINNMCNFINENKVAPEIQLVCLSNSFPIDFVIDKKYQLYNNKLFYNLASQLNLLVQN